MTPTYTRWSRERETAPSIPALAFALLACVCLFLACGEVDVPVSADWQATLWAFRGNIICICLAGVFAAVAWRVR